MIAANCGMPVGRDHGVVAEDAAEVVLVREHLVLQRQEHAGGIDEVDERQAVLAGRCAGRGAPSCTSWGRTPRPSPWRRWRSTMTCRPATVPMPVTTPADGAPPHSAYMSHAAHRPSSKKVASGSSSLAMRSRAVSRPFSCWRAMALAPPPSRMWASWSSKGMVIPESNAKRVISRLATLRRSDSARCQERFCEASLNRDCFTPATSPCAAGCDGIFSILRYFVTVRRATG